MPEPAVPGPGDVVVREEARQDRLIYVLSRAPGPDQYFLRTRDDAIRHALTFAALVRVRAWLLEGGACVALHPFTMVRGAERPMRYRANVPVEGA